MSSEAEARRAAIVIEKTAKRIYDVLRASPAERPEDVCAALGAVIGSFALATGKPRQAMDRIILIANGCLDGSLLDKKGL